MENQPLATEHRDGAGSLTYHLEKSGRNEVWRIIETLRKERDETHSLSLGVTVEMLEHLMEHGSITPIRWYENNRPFSLPYTRGCARMILVLRVHHI